MKRLVYFSIGAALVTAIALVAIPGFNKAREVSRSNPEVNCWRKVQGIQEMKEAYCKENSIPAGTPVQWEDLFPSKKSNGGKLGGSCPQGGKYILGVAGEPVRCPLPEHQNPIMEDE